MNRLQERRMALGLTQPQVSARLKETEPRADVGMVSRYEKGVCLPTADQLKALEDVLGASRTELYDAEDLGPAGGAADSREPQRGQRDGDRAAHSAHRALPQVLPHQPRVRGKPAGRPAPGVRVFVLAKLA